MHRVQELSNRAKLKNAIIRFLFVIIIYCQILLRSQQLKRERVSLTIADDGEGDDILQVMDIKHLHQSYVEDGPLHQHPHETHQPEIVQ